MEDYKKEPYQLAKMLKDFCKDFSDLTAEEGQECIDIVDKRAPYELAMFMNALKQYWNDKKK